MMLAGNPPNRAALGRAVHALRGLAWHQPCNAWGMMDLSAQDRDPTLVLVVDADDEAGRRLAQHLIHRGFRVRYTALGQDALDLAHAGRLRAVIVDVTLRDMSGHTLVSRLKEIDPRVLVLMTTGDYRPEFEVRARQIGILHYAQKPTDPERLEAVVAKALGVVRSG